MSGSRSAPGRGCISGSIAPRRTIGGSRSRSSVSELWTTAHEAVGALAAADRALRRFGAAQHRYALAPPLDAAALAAVEAALGAALPDELRAFAGELAAGGAGPGYGIVPVDRSAAYRVAAPAGAPWTV